MPGIATQEIVAPLPTAPQRLRATQNNRTTFPMGCPVTLRASLVEGDVWASRLFRVGQRRFVELALQGFSLKFPGVRRRPEALMLSPNLSREGDPPNPGFPLLPGVSTQAASGRIGAAASATVVRIADQTGQVKIVAGRACGPKELRTNPAGLAHCAATN